LLFEEGIGALALFLLIPGGRPQNPESGESIFEQVLSRENGETPVTIIRGESPRRREEK